MAEQLPLKLEDVIRFPWEGASSPDLSADGRRVVYAYQGAVWRVDTAGGEPVRLTEGTSPRWSPAAEEIAFLRGQPAQVWIRDLAGNERPVTSVPAGAGCFCWSPDGRRLAMTGPPEETAAAEPDPAKTIVELHARPPLPPGHALWVADVATTACRRVAAAPAGVQWSDPVWRPDGARVALLENASDATNAEEQLHLAVVDLGTGAVEYPAGRSRRQVGVPAWSPDGARLALPYSPHDFVHPWHWDLGVLPAAGGEVQCLASDYFIDSVCWHPDNRTLYCQGGRGSTRQVLRVDTVTGDVLALTDARGHHEHLRLSRDGQWLICTYQSPAELSEVYLLSTDGRERRRLTRVNDGLRRFRLAETEIVRWSAPDGLELEGVLVKPLGYQPGQRYPMIVDLHGGPVRGGMAEFNPAYHWLAAQGYMVFGPDFRSGQTYGWCPPPAEAADGRDYGELDFLDVMAGVDWLAEIGYADPARLGVYGFSYGSELINRIISQTDRFRAAVAVAGGVLPWEVEYGDILGGNAVMEHEFGGRPWEVPELYQRHNPLTRLHNARTHTLILRGELDGLMGAKVLYTWLYQLGVEVELVQYLGEGHVISKPEHREDAWRRTLAWFDRHLRA